MKEETQEGSFILEAKRREKTGKGYARSLRREGMLPANLYGLDLTPENLIISAKSLQKIRKSNKTLELIVDVLIDGKDKRTAILKELQKHPAKSTYIHADFNVIDVNKPIMINLPVETAGIAPGVDMGGTLQVIRRKLMAKCNPLKIPEKIVIDVSKLEMGHSIHIEDISTDSKNQGIDFVYDVNFTVIACTAPAVEKTKKEEEEEGEAAAEEKAKPGKSATTESKKA